MKATATLEPDTRPLAKRKDSIIRFEEGLIGFSQCKDFVLMESSEIAPFRLLQSIELSEVGFLVLEPTTVVKDYYSRVPAREWEAVGLTASDPHLALIICIIGSSPKDCTGNFQAPLLINHKKMMGRQIILTENGLSVRQPLL